MRLLIVGMAIFCTACTTTLPSKYAQGKNTWKEFKLANECTRTTDKKINDPRSAFRGGGIWGPSTQKYSSWRCNGDKIFYSPYGD